MSCALASDVATGAAFLEIGAKQLAPPVVQVRVGETPSSSTSVCFSEQKHGDTDINYTTTPCLCSNPKSTLTTPCILLRSARKDLCQRARPESP